MDFTQFIDSRDIAEHLKKLDYKFTMPEAAYLVYQSRRATLEEKFTTWEYIIENFPDCSMERRPNMDRIDSFHKFLRKYIDLQKRKLLNFSEPGKHVYIVIGYRRYSGEDDYIFRSHGAFSTLDTCLAFCSQQIHEFEEDELGGIIIRRLLIDNDCGDHSCLKLNTELEILDVEVSDLSDEDIETDIAFDGMAFAFPTPFERGDILIALNSGDIFVLDRLPTWDGVKCAEQGVSDWVSEYADLILDRLIKNGDISDMYVYGYEFVEDGIYLDDFGVANYLKCEYLRETLKGKQRVLKPLSSFMKGKIEKGLLCHAYHYIILEEDLAMHHQSLSREYTKEGLDEAGILVETSKP